MDTNMMLSYLATRFCNISNITEITNKNMIRYSNGIFNKKTISTTEVILKAINAIKTKTTNRTDEVSIFKNKVITEAANDLMMGNIDEAVKKVISADTTDFIPKQEQKKQQGPTEEQKKQQEEQKKKKEEEAAKKKEEQKKQQEEAAKKKQNQNNNNGGGGKPSGMTVNVTDIYKKGETTTEVVNKIPVEELGKFVLDRINNGEQIMFEKRKI